MIFAKIKTKFLRNLLSILFWSIISAAFIGPGTITVCGKAGALYDLNLSWAITFATIATILLQEGSARLQIYSNLDFGEAISLHFENSKSKKVVTYLIASSIIIGCAAYEAGNILGAKSGLEIVVPIPTTVMVAIIGIIAFIALSMKSLNKIAIFMGLFVMLMGVTFCSVAIYIGPNYEKLFVESVIPSFPDGSGLLILGLIGTTVVPYNLFLGSGLEKKQTLSEMRIGLVIAVILGGIISLAVIVVGTLIPGEFSYISIANALSENVGTWSVTFFGIGLFAAGFASAITAPLASAITARSLIGSKKSENWHPQSKYFKLFWITTLLIGVGLGMSDIEPIPAIVIAQALNGLILPLVSIALIFVLNNRKIVTQQGMNSWITNILMLTVVWICSELGIVNIVDSIDQVLHTKLSYSNLIQLAAMVVSTIVTVVIFIYIYFLRKSQKY